jgi:hypothetical protein
MSERLIEDWTVVDCIELATVGVDKDAPVATGHEAVERIDNSYDAEAYDIKAHSVYVHRLGVGATCIADCWSRDAAQTIGAALAAYLHVPVDDDTLDVDVEGAL